MNYQRQYDLLIAKARARGKVNGYSESHHVVPRACGGSDAKENLVDLTFREHYVAHWLLAKIHGGKMIQAFYQMSCTRTASRKAVGLSLIRTSRIFEKYKSLWYDQQTSTARQSYIDHPERAKALSKYWKERSEFCKDRISKSANSPEAIAKKIAYNKSDAGIERARNSVANKFHTAEAFAKSKATRNTESHKQYVSNHFKELYKNPENCPKYEGPVFGISINNPNDIVILKGAKEMKAAGFKQPKISLCINGKRKSHANRIWTRQNPQHVC